MAATGRIELRRDLTAKFDLVFKPRRRILPDRAAPCIAAD